VAIILGAVVTVLALVAAATGELKQIVDNLRAILPPLGPSRAYAR